MLIILVRTGKRRLYKQENEGNIKPNKRQKDVKTLEKKAVRSWVMYDWANSAFATTMMAAVLPVFYSTVAASGLERHLATAYWGYTQSVAMLIIAVLAPVLGSLADLAGAKVLFLRIFSYLGILSTLMFVFIGEGDWLWASILFIFASVGYSGGNVFYDALLTDLVPEEKRDYISAKGYAYGYIGGGLLLAVNMVMIQMPQLFGLPDSLSGTRLAFASVALWWFIFSLSIFRNVRDRRVKRRLNIVQYARAGFQNGWHTFMEIMKLPELLKFMIAFWFFNDGISTIIRMATIYGSEIGIGTSDLIIALFITQFVGIPFTLLFGRIAEKIGSKRSLYLSLSIYVMIVALGYFMTSAVHFYALAIMVGFVQGGSQAIARSLFSYLIPVSKSASFFGFLNISSKFAAIFGPFVFALVGQLMGSNRYGILSLLFFFIVGMALLVTVNLDKGRREAERYKQPPVLSTTTPYL